MEINIEIHGLPDIGWPSPEEIQNEIIEGIQAISVELLDKIRVTIVQDKCVIARVKEFPMLPFPTKPFLRLITDKPEKSKTLEEEAEFAHILRVLKRFNMLVEIQHISMIIRPPRHLR